MKIKYKLSLVIVGLMVLVVFAVAFSIYIFERRALLDGIKQEQETTMKHFSMIARDAIIMRDDLLLINYTNLIKRTSPFVDFAACVNKKGIFISHTTPELLHSEADDLASKDVIISEHKILEGTGKESVCVIGFSKGKIETSINNSLRKIRNRVYVVSFFGVLLGLTGALWLSHSLTSPLYKLVVGAQKIGGGDLTYHIKYEGKDEIAVLSKEFNKMADKLKELDDLKRDFVASVTHELRSPLAAIQSYVSLMIEKKNFSAEVIEDNMNRIKNNTLRLGRFINDLLDVAKIEAGKLDIVPVKVDLSKSILEMLDLFKAAALEKKINLSYKTTDGDGLYVRADEDRLKQVLTNLLNNALKFTPEGGEITVRVNSEQQIVNSEKVNQPITQSLNRSITQSPFVIVSVTDTGVGIPRESLGRIFSKFEQVQEVRDKVKGAKGTGLGLTIAKAIVELHGGKIWVESEPNKGTTFFFTLPVF